MSQSPARVTVTFLAARLGLLPGAGGGCRVAIVTFHRNLDYKSDLSIWRDTAAKAQYNPRAFYNFGMALVDRAAGTMRPRPISRRP